MANAVLGRHLQFTQSTRSTSIAVPDPKDEHQAFLLQIGLARKDHAVAEIPIYRPGQAPVWAGDQEEEDGDLLAQTQKRDLQTKSLDTKKSGGRRVEKTTLAAAITAQERRKVKAEILTADTELATRSKNLSIKEEAVERPSIDTSNLEVPEAEGAESDSEGESRRARARERAKKRQEEEQDRETRPEGEEEDAAEGGEAGEENAEGSESEYETDSEEEDDNYAARKLPKPIFVSKKDRDTLEERSRIEEEQKQVEEDTKERLKQRKKQTLQIVADEIKREDEDRAKGGLEEEELPPDEDDVDEQQELDQWKVRELRRIKRDKEKRDRHDKEKAETEKRRDMTDQEISADNRLHAKPQAPKGTMRFLQKYYHPGAFYQEEPKDRQLEAEKFRLMKLDMNNLHEEAKVQMVEIKAGATKHDIIDKLLLAKDLRLRDFMQPTGEDRTIDRTLLPKVMQVKKFGLKGRTKYTHLVDQDTTVFEQNPWTNSEPILKGKSIHQLAGTMQLPKRQKR